MITNQLTQDEKLVYFAFLREEKLPCRQRVLERMRARRQQALEFAREWRTDAARLDVYGEKVCRDFARTAREWEQRAGWVGEEIDKVESEIADLLVELEDFWR